MHSAVEVTKFLLQEGFEFVLTERFCQDPVEEYFRGQQKLGRHSDNPDIKTFGYNSNTLRMQRTVSVRVATQRAERTRHEPGNKLLLLSYHVEKAETVVN